MLERQGTVVLDGGLATALEARGHDLAHELWSARTLVEEPDAVRAVHLAYLQAGADCIATATYQATRMGFERLGLERRGFERRWVSPVQALEWLERGIQVAVSARDDFWSSHHEAVEPQTWATRLEPLVAASVGPYGAFLADGSEYRGDYDVGAAELRDFHEERLALFAGTDADLIACETIPSGPEVEVLVDLLEETPGAWGWVSLQCRDGAHLADGSSLAEAVARCDAADSVAAIGVNCVAPALVPDLLETMRDVSSKPLAAYPNSGEHYDAIDKVWASATEAARGSALDWVQSAPAWVTAGARVVGGCCRTSPDDIRRLRTLLLPGA